MLIDSGAITCHSSVPVSCSRCEQRFEAEIDQDAAGVGRQLQPGAGFLEPLIAFQNDNPETACGQRQRRGQSPDARTSDNDGA